MTPPTTMAMVVLRDRVRFKWGTSKDNTNTLHFLEPCFCGLYSWNAKDARDRKGRKENQVNAKSTRAVE